MREKRPDPVPHLKLSPSRLIPVLEVIRKSDGDRGAATEAIRHLYGPKFESKSVVRGMAFPAGTRLQMIRVDDDAVVLAPNGWGVFESGLKPEAFVAVALRSVAIHRFGMSPTGLSRLSEDDLGTSDLEGRAKERGSTFIHYIRYFPASKSEWKLSGMSRVPGQSWELPIARDEARNLLDGAGPAGEVVSLDDVRTKVLRKAWSKRWLATSFDVDRWIVREAKSARPILSLWRQAAPSLDELLIQGNSYGGVLFRGG